MISDAERWPGSDPDRQLRNAQMSQRPGSGVVLSVAAGSLREQSNNHLNVGSGSIQADPEHAGFDKFYFNVRRLGSRGSGPAELFLVLSHKRVYKHLF